MKFIKKIYYWDLISKEIYFPSNISLSVLSIYKSKYILKRKIHFNNF